VPSYRFEAADAAGQVEKGVLEADGARAARAQLRARGLVPFALEPLAASAGETKGWAPLRLREAELATATRHIAALLSAKLPLATALTAIIDQSERAATRETLAAVRSEVVAGARFADALGRFPRLFPQVYRATVAAGEQAGDLALVMERLADYLEQRQALRSKVLSATLYPAVVTLVAVAIVLFLMTYVLPQVVQVFAQTSQSLPLPTRILLAISAFLRTFGLWLVILLPVLGFALGAWLQRPGPKAAWHALLLRLPLLGAVLRIVDTARFAGTLAMLAAAGVPVLRALEGARATLRNTVLAEAVSDAIAQVREGEALAKALGATRAFPAMLIHLIASGEATGDLARMLDRAAALLAREVERRLLMLTALLEPLLILAMGAMVLGIVLAVLLPIIDINQLVR
jgi:general secretion pathway protein F